MAVRQYYRGLCLLVLLTSRCPRRPSREGQVGAAPEGQRPAAAVKLLRAGQQSYGPTVAPAGDRALALADPPARVARPPCGIPDTCGQSLLPAAWPTPTRLPPSVIGPHRRCPACGPTSVESWDPGNGARSASAASKPTRTAPLMTRAVTRLFVNSRSSVQIDCRRQSPVPISGRPAIWSSWAILGPGGLVTARSKPRGVPEGTRHRASDELRRWRRASAGPSRVAGRSRSNCAPTQARRG